MATIDLDFLENTQGVGDPALTGSFDVTGDNGVSTTVSYIVDGQPQTGLGGNDEDWLGFDGDDSPDSTSPIIDLSFDTPVTYFTFDVYDFDQGSWDDQLRIIASGPDGPVEITWSTTDNSAYFEDTADGSDASNGILIIEADSNGNNDTISISIVGPLTNVQIFYEDGDQLDNNAGSIAVGNLSFVDVQDDVVSGTDGDDIIDGTYEDDPQFEQVDNNDSTGLLTGNQGSNDDIIEGNGGDDQISAGQGNDSVDGGQGQDTVDGGTGNDTIVDTGTSTETVTVTEREVLEWNEVGTNGTIVEGGFSYDTGNNTVTFSVLNDVSTTSVIDTGETITTTGIDTGGLGSADTNSSLEIQTNDDNDQATVELAFDSEVENVSFRITDIENLTTVTITAYDEAGNAQVITLTDIGSDLTSADGLVATLTSDDGNELANDPADAATISIDGPVSRIEITVDNNDPGFQDNSNPQISDVYFDTVVSTSEVTVSADDTIDGGEGADTISGGDGSDSLTGGSGDDDIYVGGGDVAFGGTGDDDFFIDSTDSSTDVNATIDGQSDATGTGSETSLDPDDMANGDDGDTLDLSSLTGDGVNGATTGVTVVYDADPENGTVDGIDTDGASDISFTEIENIIYTGDDDIADASSATTGVTIDTAEGDDTITGSDSSDTIVVGGGSDTIDGGEGTDIVDATLSTSPQDETITVSVNDAGDGTLTTQSDNATDTITSVETYIAQEGQTVTDGNDVITLTDVAEVDDVDLDDTAIGVFTPEDTNFAPIAFGGPGEPLLSEILSGSHFVGGDKVVPVGSYQITDGEETGTVGNISFENFETINFSIICFARGTRIRTPKGEIAVEDLCEGDLVATADRGNQPLRWIGSTKRPAQGALAPIKISKGALGNQRDLFVSPQHRMMVSGWQAQLNFGVDAVLAPAKAMINDQTIRPVYGGEVEYFHMLFDQHEIIFAEGSATESFHPGQEGWNALDCPTRREILDLFPMLADEALGAYGATVRPSLTVREGQILLAGLT